MLTATTSFKKLVFLIAISILLLSSNAFSQELEIYVCDAGNFSSIPGQILKFDESGENPEVFIDTNLAWPQDILFLDEQNIVLISNFNTGRITKYNSVTGDYIENFATGLGAPTRMKIGSDSLLYVLQWSGSGKVRRYELDGTFIDEFTSVGVTQSIGIDWDNAGNLYISSYGGGLVRKFDPDGNDLGVFVNSNLSGPTNIWFDDNGDLLVIDYNGTAVKRFDSSGTFINNFLTGLSQAEGVDFFPNGNILIGNGTTSSVKMFDSNGNYIEDFIPSGSGNLLTPNAIVIREVNPSSVSGDENSFSPDNFVLEQNYPNPFNPTTSIRFRIASASGGGFVTLKIFNLLGMELATLVEEYKPAGTHKVEFNAAGLSSGVYFYQLKVGNPSTSPGQAFIETKKMTYLK